MKKLRTDQSQNWLSGDKWILTVPSPVEGRPGMFQWEVHIVGFVVEAQYDHKGQWKKQEVFSIGPWLAGGIIQKRISGRTVWDIQRVKYRGQRLQWQMTLWHDDVQLALAALFAGHRSFHQANKAGKPRGGR
jgi:hypothetical protein